MTFVLTVADLAAIGSLRHIPNMLLVVLRVDIDPMLQAFLEVVRSCTVAADIDIAVASRSTCLKPLDLAAFVVAVAGLDQQPAIVACYQSWHS